MNEAMYRVPTWRERLWRRLGYRYHLGEDPEGVDALAGWMCTESRMHFGVADRLRLLRPASCGSASSTTCRCSPISAKPF